MKKPVKKHSPKILYKKFVSILPVLALVVFIIYKSNVFAQTVSAPLRGDGKYDFMEYPCSLTDHNEEVPEEESNFARIYSKRYTEKLAAFMGPENKVSNYAFLTTNTNGTPNGFMASTLNGPAATYEVKTEGQTKYLYAEKHGSDGTDISPTWLFDRVTVEPKTYGFSFTYRAPQPVMVIMELQMPDGSSQYSEFAQATPSGSWKTFIGHIDNSDYKASKFRFFLSTKNNGSVDSHSYKVFTLPSAGLSEGMVSIAFDDGWKSIYQNALPLLNEYGFKSTQYIVSEYSVNEMINYMTTDQVKQMAHEGHEIGAHSIRHCDLTTITLDQLEYEAEEGKKSLGKKGLEVTSFAHPFGSYSATTMAVLDDYYSLIRSTDRGLNDRYFDPNNIYTQTVHNTTTIEEIRGWIDAAKTSKKWLILTYHRIGEDGKYSVTTEQLREQFEAVKTSGLDVLTINKAAERIQNLE